MNKFTQTLCLALALAFNVLQAQDYAKIVILNANNAYPKFIVSLNGVRITNDYSHSSVFNYADETNYRVKILQAGSSNVLKFNISSEPRYESKFLLVQDNAGQFSLVLQSKSLLMNSEVSDDQDQIPVRGGGNPQVYGSKIPTNNPSTGSTTNPTVVVVTVAAPVNVPPPAPTAMSSEVFNRKYNEVKAKTFDNEKLERAKQAFSEEKMNVNQVISIMKMFTFDDDKVNFAKFAYSRTIDKSEFYRTYDLITFTFTREDFEKWVNGQKK